MPPHLLHMVADITSRLVWNSFLRGRALGIEQSLPGRTLEFALGST